MKTIQTKNLATYVIAEIVIVIIVLLIKIIITITIYIEKEKEENNLDLENHSICVNTFEWLLLIVVGFEKNLDHSINYLKIK